MKELSSSSPSSSSGSLYARFELDDGPSTPSPVGVQFFVDGASLSGIDLLLMGNGKFPVIGSRVVTRRQGGRKLRGGGRVGWGLDVLAHPTAAIS